MNIKKLQTVVNRAALGATAAAATLAVRAEDSALAVAAKAGIDAAKAEGMSVGGMVVGAVALFVVVGIVISMVKKA